MASLLLSRPLTPAALSFLSPPKRNPRPVAMAGAGKPPSASHSPASSPPGGGRKLPVLLFDVMDTLVRDPFYEDVPAFFGMPMKELLEHKHPTSWMEFEMGLIDEGELARKFFKDGRPIDLEDPVVTGGNGRFGRVERGQSANSFPRMRKPAAELYMEVSQRLGIVPASCVFIDDRITNVQAAVNAGMVGIHFKTAASLLQDLSLLGFEINGVNTEFQN